MDKQYTVQEIKEAKKALEVKLCWFLSEEIDKFQSVYCIPVNNIVIEHTSFRELVKTQDTIKIIDVRLRIRI